MTYTYTRHGMTKHAEKAWPVATHDVIFVCKAETILAADELLLAATGIVAAKAANIGCAVN